MTNKPAYPSLVCNECGTAYGRKPASESSTWHASKCDVCGREANVTEPRDFGHVKYLDEPTRCEDHGFYSWIRGCPYCAELQPCDHCGKLPGVVQDNTGLLDCTHICRGADGICGVINCDTRAEAIVRWNQLQERKKDK